MVDPNVEVQIRTYTAERTYSPATVDRWLRLAPPDAAALLALARELRLGENQLRDLWDWAEEIAARDGICVSQVLTAGPLADARTRGRGRNDTLKAIKGALRRLRFPQLAAVEDRLSALVRELGLPRNVRVTLPEFLEGDQLHIHIVAESTNTLRHAASALLQAADTVACQQIFTLLEEAP